MSPGAAREAHIGPPAPDCSLFATLDDDGDIAGPSLPDLGGLARTDLNDA